MKFEVYNNAGGQARWRLDSGTGHTVAAAGESFESAGDAKKAAETFKQKAKKLTYDCYADAGGNYRWRALDGDVRLGSSGESFETEFRARRAASSVRDNAASATGP